jgi:hypothetical protein
MEPGESGEFEARLRARNSGWKLHGVVLLLWTALYLFAFADKLGASGLSGLGAFVFGLMLLGYAAITTLVMAFLGRRPAAPIVMHALALAGFVTWAVVATQRHDADARPQARATGREPPPHCLRVRGVHVIEGTPLRAFVRLANACDDAVTVAQVTVAGEVPDGDLLLKEPPDQRSVPPNQNIKVEVAADQRGATNTAGWNWAVFVELAAPATAMCYATPGSSRRDVCAMMGAVEPAPL